MIKFLPYILAIGSIIGLLSYVYWKGGEDKETVIVKKQLEETIKDQEKLNEIRNNRPDNAKLIDSLLNGSF